MTVQAKPAQFKHEIKKWLHVSLAVLLGLIVSETVFAAQGGRGAAPARGGGAPAPAANSGNTGNRGGAANNAAEARQQIQANKKAAIDRAQAQFQLSMLTAKQDGASASDSKAREHAQIEIQQAQAERKRAIDKANADAKAALAALPKGR